MSYFPDPYTRSKNKVNVELDLSNYDYATKSDLKNATVVNTSKFAKKADLASLKSDIDKLKLVPVDAVVYVIGISGFVLKTQFNTDKSGLGKKINDAGKKTPDTSGLINKKNRL